MRGIAAYAVLYAHLLNLCLPYAPIGNIAFMLAYFGMTLFFVLSGFVIMYNYGPKFLALPFHKATVEFFVARFARLYPLYFVILLISVQYIPTSLMTLTQFISYASLTQAWYNWQHIAFAHAWSISAEWFFYVLFVFAVPFLARIGTKRGVMTALLTVLVLSNGYLAYISSHRVQVAEALLIPFDHPANKNFWSWIEYYSPYPHIGSFFLGAIAAVAYRVMGDVALSERALQNGRRLNRVAIAFLAVCMTLVALKLYFSSSYLEFISHGYIYAPAIAWLCFGFGRYGGWCADRLGRGAFITMGDISYSVYLLQWPLFSLMPGFVQPGGTALAIGNSLFKIAMLTGIVTIFARASYMYFEVPSRRFLRRVLAPKTSPKLI